MSLINLKRLQRELSDLKKDNNAFNIEMISNVNFTATINGPSGTPYEGGKFQIGLRIPDNYPMVPPVVHFQTLVWHPNIASTRGFVCLDVLDKNWSPIQSIRTILLSLEGLLESPEPTDPLDGIVAHQFLQFHDDYVKTAEHWTNVYADGPKVHADYNEMVETLRKIAGTAERARHALSCTNWDMASATELLF